MKLSAQTKTTAAEYVTRLKQQVEAELKFEIPLRIFAALRQRYEHELHTLERSARVSSLSAEAEELGYVLEPKNRLTHTPVRCMSKSGFFGVCCALDAGHSGYHLSRPTVTEGPCREWV